MLSGELRIGLREGLLEAALAKAFDRPLDAVKRAGMLTGDIGQTAMLARDGRLGDAQMTLFHPLKFMLASPAEDAAEIVRRLGPTVWVEDKYDGIRAQLHRRGSDVRLYSRDLHDISGQFPEVVEGARDLPWSGILDGEILAWKDGVVLPFLQLQARLGRKNPSAKILAEIPVIYVAWDVLGMDRDADTVVTPVLEEPLTERRRRLETLELPPAAEGGRFALSHLVSVDSVDGLEAAFAEARARRNEGLLVKDPTSAYSPGRRGLGWLKMKKALATIDCVVVGVEVGHGKRHGVLSDYTFAVRDEASGQLVTIGKAYSGLTDAEIAEMTRWFLEHTISVHGRYRVVEPLVVVEVAFDVIMRSARHKSGFALRFPRIANLRPDKPVDEIDTLARRDPPVRGPPARRRAPGDGERQEVVPAGPPAAPRGWRVRDAGPYAGADGARAPGETHEEPEMFAAFNELQRLEITLYTDALITHGLVRTRQHRVSDILNLSEDPFLILEDVTVEEFGQRRGDDHGGVRADQPRRGAVRGRDHAGGAGARAAHAEGAGGGDHLDPPVPGDRDHAPAADGGKPAGGAVRAPGPLPADHRGDLLVRSRRRAAPAGGPGRGEPPAGADPRAAQGQRPVGGRRRPGRSPRPRRPIRTPISARARAAAALDPWRMEPPPPPEG